jgi:hypothetical protein
MAAKPRKRNRQVKTNGAGRELMASIREALHAARTGDMTGLTVRRVESSCNCGGTKIPSVTPREIRNTLPS